ncbi:MAG: PAS domain-containing protein [Chloroflexi bacterium]|nr:PAS domain-containing protein [Chloroflexota bacterium]
MSIRLHAFPSADPEFGAHAQSCLDALPEPASPAALQRAIRLRYPAAIVKAQDELARHGSAPVIWYAYRTALLTWRDDERAGPWPAWAILDDERRFLQVNPELAAIAELPAEVMLGHRVEEFSNPTDPTIRDDIAQLWIEFLERRSIASTVRFNFADGRPRELGYWLEADVDGFGRHRLSVRELDR